MATVAARHPSRDEASSEPWLPPVERAVAGLYAALWPRLGDVRRDDVLRQFLNNVGLPATWYPGRLCLDAGCGAGHAVWCLERLGARPFACDISLEALAQLRRRFPGCEGARRAVFGTVLQLPWPDGFFDLVHASGVLHHTRDPARAFGELARVTRPGGVLYVGVYGRGGLVNGLLRAARPLARRLPRGILKRTVRTLAGRRTVPRSFMPLEVSLLDNLCVALRNSLSERDLREWFRGAGFADERVVRVPTTLYDLRRLPNRLLHGEGWIQLRGTRDAGESASAGGYVPSGERVNDRETP